MNNINGICIDDYIGFVFDGCHKIYLVKEEDIPSVNEKWGNGYEDEPVYSMEWLPKCYETSCLLRFISSWDLKTHFVRQCEENVKFVINEEETIVE